MAIKSWKLPSHRVAVVVFIIIFFDLFFSSTKAVASIEFLLFAPGQTACLPTEGSDKGFLKIMPAINLVGNDKYFPTERGTKEFYATREKTWQNIEAKRKTKQQSASFSRVFNRKGHEPV